ncbi:nucleotide exchange factor GrpE [Pseudonocardia sp. TMWB2A]|uniref:nucleotide exchange factor GrpE n=1 Tax=Pseudonocardia sp. TMWB2A TaxID=687430 RepID=UPI00307DEE9D
MTDHNKNQDPKSQSPKSETDVIDEALDSVGLEDEAVQAGAGADPLAKRVLELEEEIAKAKQDVLYAQADTQNVRRRLEKDAQDARAYAATNFARDILSVADNLERAMEAVPESIRNDDAAKGFVAGIEATQREIISVFERNGISRIEALGQTLDPNKHQAMVEVPSADAEPGTIIHEMQKGYMIKDRLLRPALVGVAKKPD